MSTDIVQYVVGSSRLENLPLILLIPVRVLYYTYFVLYLKRALCQSEQKPSEDSYYLTCLIPSEIIFNKYSTVFHFNLQHLQNAIPFKSSLYHKIIIIINTTNYYLQYLTYEHKNL